MRRPAECHGPRVASGASNRGAYARNQITPRARRAFRPKPLMCESMDETLEADYAGNVQAISDNVIFYLRAK
jgi:hypothetical protein